MAFEIDASQVVSMFGDYYKNNGQGVKDINAALRHSFETKNAFTVVETDDSVLDNLNTEFGEVLQSFQKTYTPKGSIKFIPNRIQTFELKVDTSFYPDDLKRSYLEFLTTKNLDRSTWPFVRWVVEVYLMAQIQQDFELEAIFKGVYQAPTAGTANAAVDTMNGIKKIINDGITATKIAPIVTGALSTDPAAFCTQIETFIEAIPSLYRRRGLELNMADSLLIRYMKGRRAKYNNNYNQVSDLQAVEYYPNIKLHGYESHEGSEKIWASPKLNSILAFKGIANLSNFKIETDKREVAIFTDFRVGLGWLNDNYLFTNDQDVPEDPEP